MTRDAAAPLRDCRMDSGEDSRQRFFEAFSREAAGLFPDQAEEDLLLLCVVEAVNNAAEHGNRNDPAREIHARWLLLPGLAMVCVADQGPGFEPVFPDLPSVTGPRGRGLGLIKGNTDAVLFNRPGNELCFLKGGKTMNTNLRNAKAAVTFLGKGAVLVSDLAFGEQKSSIALGMSELLEEMAGIADRTVFIDLRNVRLITSMGWGAIFAHVESPDMKGVVLFNANEAILKAAGQMGIGTRTGAYEKIRLFPDSGPAMEILAGTLSA